MGKKKDKNKSRVERRFFGVDNGSEIRLVRKDGEPVKIVGYFAKFGKKSRNLGWFTEIIEEGFFRSALKMSDPVDLFNHDANIILGRVSSGTLKVWEDKVGLAYECTPPDTQIARDMVLTPIERGDVKGCSFGFTVKSKYNGDDVDGDTWFEDQDGSVLRTLKKDGCSELYDGSQVVFPAYPDTDCALRSMEEWKKNNDDIKQKELEQKEKDDEEKRKLQEQAEKELEEQELKDNHFKIAIKRKRQALRNRNFK